VQRRHQKLLEEAPSNRVSAELRERIGKTIEGALSAIGYSNAGTVEFLMDERGDLHFIELNARIQVEHPVTEMVTGVDLVKSQLLLASGARIEDVLPETIEIRGHAIECRINAENPDTFAPSAGLITKFVPPGGIGIRVDSAAYSDWFVPPYYDSLVAKLIVHGPNRTDSMARMRRALDVFVVEGIHTSITLQQRILSDEGFIGGDYDTHFIERLLSH
jgi:acetyl-CoA carboxylase biotin carboxylase subunit